MPSDDAEARASITQARFNDRNNEIQWRGLERDGSLVAAFLTAGALLPVGPVALAGPVLLIFWAAVWVQHDRRIGSCARYLRDVVEPAMRQFDDVQSYEDFLDTTESDRSYLSRHSFSTVSARLCFPTLQGLTWALGCGQYAGGTGQTGLTTAAVVAVSIFDWLLIGLTMAKVKHVRTPSQPTP